MNGPAILVVTGASGAGKTSAVQLLEKRSRPGIRCFYLDHIGVPSIEIMERDFGSGGKWQAYATNIWISRLAREGLGGQVNILDGQTRPAFVHSALDASGNPKCRIVLFDCSPSARRSRLERRGQPELASLQMDTWATFLRNQAEEFGIPIIETTNLTIEMAADAIEDQVELLRVEAGQ